MKVYVGLMLIVSGWMASTAYADWYFDPHAAVGFNSSQGTHLMLGADLGMDYNDQIKGGVGAYFSAGEHPEHDREFGVGPFVTYVQPMTSFLLGQVRQEINYVNLHDPIKSTNASGQVSYTHNEEQGFASVTSASVHLFFTKNFVLSAGYRLVIGLTNGHLDDGRSGTFLGLAIGF